ncbi:MAG: ATP-binding cassette domain-containing protein, partial [Acidimicrobiales bacterium]
MAGHEPAEPAPGGTGMAGHEPAAGGVRPPLLSLEGIRVTYGRAVAVRSVSLDVAAGEAVGLVGPNGAGKSSTLLAVMGAVKCSEGDIRLRGRSVRGLPPDAVARQGVALVPEGRHLFPRMSVRENLVLGSLARR